MMAEILWSPGEIADIIEISDYVSQTSSFYANRVTEGIVSRTEIVLAQPHSGRAIPESKNPNYREVFQFRYRIMYSLELLPDIKIMRIFHMPRQFLNL